MGGLGGPPGIEVGGDQGRATGGEVVPRRRSGESRAPPERVVGAMDRRELGLHGGEGDRRDVVAGVVVDRATLEIEGGADQREAPVADLEVVAESGGREEGALGRGRLEGVVRVRGVDRAVGTRDRLAAVGELEPCPSVLAVLLGLGRPELREQRPGRTHRLDVAPAGVEEIAVGLLGHVAEVGDERERAGHRPGREAQEVARRLVLDQTHRELESGAGPDPEQSGRAAFLGIDRPEECAARRELVDDLSVVAREVDVPRGVDDRLGGLFVRGERAREREGTDLAPTERVDLERGPGVHVEVGRGRCEAGDTSLRGDHRRGRRGGKARRRPEHTGRVGRFTDGADLRCGGCGHRARDLRCGGCRVGGSDDARQGGGECNEDDDGSEGEDPLRAWRSHPAYCPLHNSPIGGWGDILRKFSLTMRDPISL